MKYHVVMKVPAGTFRSLASDIVMTLDVFAGDNEAAQGLALNYYHDSSFKGLAQVVSCTQVEEPRYEIVGYNQLLLLGGADHGLVVLEHNVPESDVVARVAHWSVIYQDTPGYVVQSRPVGFDAEQAQEMTGVTVDAPAAR